MLTVETRDLFRFQQSPTLFIAITNECNINCKYCYIHNNKPVKKCLDIGEMISAIEEVSPGKLVITGGEPLLYPSNIIGVMNYFNAHYRNHWNSTICTNLLIDEINEKHIEAINKFDYLQTTFETKRLENKFELFKYNFNYVKSRCNNIKFFDIIYNISDEEVELYKDNPPIEKMAMLNPNGISFEFRSNSKDYSKLDLYLNKCFEKLSKYKNIENLTKTSWDNSIKSNYYINCNKCNSGLCKIYSTEDPDNVYNGCICKSNNKRTKSKISKCIECELFKYCRFNCERFGDECGFPKETFKKFLKERS